jgi:hypothetical protein
MKLLDAAKCLLAKARMSVCEANGDNRQPYQITRHDASVVQLQEAVDAAVAAEKNYGDRALNLNKALTGVMRFWSESAAKGGEDDMPVEIFDAAWTAIADYSEWTNEERMAEGLPIRGTLHCPACSHRLGGIIVFATEHGGTCDTCGHEVSL